MTQQETTSTLPAPARSKRHKILTIAAAVLTALLVVPGAVTGGLLSVIFTFLLVPALCLVRAYRVRSGRRWLIGSVLIAVAMLAATVPSVLDGGEYAWLSVMVVAYNFICIAWGEGERRFSSEKRWFVAENVAAEHGTTAWFVANASPAGAETRVVLHADGREPWSTAIWGTVQPGMVLVLNPARQILHATWS